MLRLPADTQAAKPQIILLINLVPLLITRPFMANFNSDCAIEIAQEILLPNNDAEATIAVLFPENLDDILLSKGILFDIREGERTIGNGQIILGQEQKLEKNTLAR
jgi:hypothetical protein